MNTKEKINLIKQVAKLSETVLFEINEESIHLKFYSAEEYIEFKKTLKAMGIPFIDCNGGVVATPRGNLLDGLEIKLKDI